MNAIDAIKARRSTRRFQVKEVPRDVLETVLLCGRLAPSAGNRQPWVFVVAQSQDVKDALAGASGQAFVAGAPVVVVMCADPERCAVRYEDRGRSLYVFQDTAAAMTNMMIAATSFGLGTCWVGAFKESQVRSALKLPDNLRPVAMLPLGYPAQTAGPRNLREAEQVIWYK